MANISGEVLKNFNWHASHRDGPGASLFTARMAEALLDVLDERSALGRRLLTWPDTAGPDAIALRAIAAFHALARTGTVAELSAVYPPAVVSDEHLRAAIRTAIQDADPFLAAYLDTPPQTNEVGRSSMILGACLKLADRFGLPLALFEIGSSAGLNLRLADYRYEFGGGRTWGRPDAPVTIVSGWRGDNLPPLDAPLSVLTAAGCDVSPLDPRNDRDAARLVSYVWADQFDRLERIEAALRNASRDHIRVTGADAGAWLEAMAGGPAPQAVTRLVFHTVVWQYLDQPTKGRITATMERAGAAATTASPLAWFRFENDGPELPGGYMAMRVWPGGEDVQLGRADFHGRWVDWA